MIHGMEEGAMLPPHYQGSEAKVGLAAAQLRKSSPGQLQLYTIQIDFARSVYTSGQWFNNNSQCLLQIDGKVCAGERGGQAGARGITGGVVYREEQITSLSLSLSLLAPPPIFIYLLFFLSSSLFRLRLPVRSMALLGPGSARGQR